MARYSANEVFCRATFLTLAACFWVILLLVIPSPQLLQGTGGTAGGGTPHPSPAPIAPPPTTADSLSFPSVTYPVTPDTAAAPPTLRSSAMIAYDIANGYVMLFGGYSGAGALGDTWGYRGGSWEELWATHGTTCQTGQSSCKVCSTTDCPAPRFDGEMAYDGYDHYVLLFGGSSNTGLLNDTWKFVNDAWTQLSPTGTIPCAEMGGGMAFDGSDGYMVQFGGYTGATCGSIPGSFNGYTSKFKADVWTTITNSQNGGPSPRYAMAYTNASTAFTGGGIILVGGFAAGGLLNDVWRFTSGAWVSVSSTGGPSARQFASIAFDLQTDTDILFGGEDPSGETVSNICNFPASAYCGSPLGDTWELTGTSTTATWKEICNDVSSGSMACEPYPRWDAAMVTDYEPETSTYADPHGLPLMFGGSSELPTEYLENNGWEALGGTWFTDVANTLSLSSYAAVTWVSAFWPISREEATATDESNGDDMLMFGGLNDPTNTTLGDTWQFTENNQDGWDQVGSCGDLGQSACAATADPAPRSGAGLAGCEQCSGGYDVLFGGLSASGSYLGDTWGFYPGSLTWGEIWATHGTTCEADQAHCTVCSTTNCPSPRGCLSSNGMSWSSANSAVILFGGCNSGGALGDTWTFYDGNWTEVCSTSCGPAAREWQSLSDDPPDNYLVMFGGLGSGCASTPCADTWQFYNTRWTKISSSNSIQGGAYQGGMDYFSASSTTAVPYLSGNTCGTISANCDSDNVNDYSAGSWTSVCNTGGCTSGEWLRQAAATAVPNIVSGSRDGITQFGGVYYYSSGVAGQVFGADLTDTWIFNPIATTPSPPIYQESAY